MPGATSVIYSLHSEYREEGKKKKKKRWKEPRPGFHCFLSSPQIYATEHSEGLRSGNPAVSCHNSKQGLPEHRGTHAKSLAHTSTNVQTWGLFMTVMPPRTDALKNT